LQRRDRAITVIERIRNAVAQFTANGVALAECYARAVIDAERHAEPEPVIDAADIRVAVRLARLNPTPERPYVIAHPFNAPEFARILADTDRTTD
jgi:hypothetical protein